MAVLDLVIYPDTRLRRATHAVVDFNAQLKELAENMTETMYHHNGVGLAAPQIGEALKLFVVDVSESRDQPQIFINPEILEKHGEREYEEGCLSVPSYYAKVKRPDLIKVKAQDLLGQYFETTAEGLFSTCIQHEYDHLQGALFIDYLSKLKQSRAEKKVNKWVQEHSN